MPADCILRLVLQPPIVAILMAFGFLAAGLRAYDRAALSSVTIAVVASLAALASAGRVAFAFIPNVQPTTFIVATTGIALGPAQGYMVGVLSVLASNVFLGHGPWTPWQMAAWGLAGASAGVLGVLVPDVNSRRLALFLGLWGFIFGFIMNVWHWLSFTFPLSLKTLMVVEAAGLWFDAMHAAGNVVFALVFGDHMLKTLRRFTRRLKYVISVTLLLVLPLGSLAPLSGAHRPARASASYAAPEDVNRAIARGIAYLRSCQNPDGGFPATPGGHSSEMVTSWVVMGIRSAGLDPSSADWKRGTASPAGFLLNASGFAGDSAARSTDIARRALAFRALGMEEHRQVVAPLTRALASRQKADGRFEGEGEEGLLNAHFWSIIALSYGDTPNIDRASALRFLLSQSNNDGGFGFASGLPSDPDDTAAAIQAMVALGETGEALDRAVRYLAGTVSAEGGIVWEGGRPNVASASWALQAFNAARGHISMDVTGPRDAVTSWICGLQAGDGSFVYMEGSDSMPLWMTADAILALSGLPFPLAVGFSDLPPSHWAAPQVHRLAGLGIVTGYPGGLFRPRSSVTRAELAVMLARIVEANKRASTPGRGFRDVPPSHWARQAVATACELGFMRGLRPGVFGPDDPVTGGQMAAVACRVAGLVDPPAAPGQAWHEPYTSAAGRLGLLYPGFSAEAAATRSGCAYALEGAIEIAGAAR